MIRKVITIQEIDKKLIEMIAKKEGMPTTIIIRMAIKEYIKEYVMKNGSIEVHNIKDKF